MTVQGDTKVTGVFGYPVEHSLSPAMHNAAFAALHLKYIYVPFSVAPENLGAALRGLPALGIVGVNLTIPHKEAALPHCHTISDAARDIGAVNTIHVVNGELRGDNTDGQGFYEPLREIGVAVAGKNVVVLGAGGAARSVVFRLAREGASVTLVNRTIERAAKLAADVERAGYSPVAVLPPDSPKELTNAIAAAELLVHTTKVGMMPYPDAMPPIPLEAFHPDLFVYDLIYRPAETQILRVARKRGCRTLNGLKMLAHQGAAAFEIWTGQRPPTDVMEEAISDFGF